MNSGKIYKPNLCRGGITAMRINPVSTTNYQTSLKPKVQIARTKEKDDGLTRPINLDYLNRTYNQVNFKKAVPTNSSLSLIKQIPLEDRLASIFENFKLGDLILVGKNLSESARKMYKNTNVVKNAIKRGFFIEDDTIGGNLGFIKNMLGDTEVINLNDSAVTLISENKTYSMKPQESFYVINGDILNVDGNLLTIKDKSKTDLSMYRKNFARAFDFQKEVEPQIERINKKTISSLMQAVGKKSTPVTFAQVGGLGDLKEALKRDIVYPLKYPEAYENIKLDHGAILYGPPGTGKTHIARALANEAGTNFISINGLEMESKWVGQSEENWRNLFNEAKENQPTLIFLDEFDAVARSRSSNNEYGNNVVNQILTLMTDLDNENANVFVIGATNNFDALDKAIIRPGRFGKHYEVPVPDIDGLREIYKIHSSAKPMDEKINVEELLQKLYNHKATGAGIKQIVNDAHNNGYERAGIFEKMANKTFTPKDLAGFKITQEDIDKAYDNFIKYQNSSTRKQIGFGR